jgi:type VI protein secretion system component VasF
MVGRDVPDPGQVSIERQLGDVVGTVRMAVSAIEALRETVERLAERAAFRADLEALRSEMRREMEDLEVQLQRQSSSASHVQKWVWMAMGGLAVITFIVNILKPALTVTMGG